jgi:hypothetical protein
MLILTMRVGETLMIGSNVAITVVGLKGDQVRIGINAPQRVFRCTGKSSTISSGAHSGNRLGHARDRIRLNSQASSRSMSGRPGLPVQREPPIGAGIGLLRASMPPRQPS